MHNPHLFPTEPLLHSTLLVHSEKEKSLVNQRFTRDLWYPDPHLKY